MHGRKVETKKKEERSIRVFVLCYQSPPLAIKNTAESLFHNITRRTDLRIRKNKIRSLFSDTINGSHDVR